MTNLLHNYMTFNYKSFYESANAFLATGAVPINVCRETNIPGQADDWNNTPGDGLPKDWSGSLEMFPGYVTLQYDGDEQGYLVVIQVVPDQVGAVASTAFQVIGFWSYDL